MCEPTTIAIAASVALAAGSAYMQNESTNKQIEARDNATSAELERQDVFQKNTAKLFDQSLGEFAPEKQSASLAALVSGREDKIRGNAAAVGGSPAPVTSNNAPRVISDEFARQSAGAVNRSGSRAKSLARLGSVPELFSRNNLSLNRYGLKMGTEGGFARSSGALLPLDLAEANKAGSSQRNIAALLGLASTGANAYGASGGGKSGGSFVASDFGNAGYAQGLGSGGFG